MTLLDSWVESANSATTPFPLNNLPFAAYLAEGEDLPRVCVAIGDSALDLTACEATGLLGKNADWGFGIGSVNALMQMGPEAWADLRDSVQKLLARGSRLRSKVENHLHTLSDLEDTLGPAVSVMGYTDFYASRHHATNVGALMRGAENALPPNWLHMPIGYNGRASTVVGGGGTIRRPLGQMRPQGLEAPVFGPSRRLDFELELAAVVAGDSEMGAPLTVREAEEMIFGFMLLNDWSARDIQGWEYQPLGPFQGKAFATSVGPWLVPKAALEAFRTEAPAREKPLLPYLQDRGPMHYDIALEAALLPAEAGRATTITRTNARHLYWSAAQMLAHHAVSGCLMEAGDLLGSGTVSGPEPGSRACLLELSEGGKAPLILETGEKRTFLEDGDTVILTGWAQGEGYRIGFGECSGRIEAAAEQPDWGE